MQEHDALVYRDIKTKFAKYMRGAGPEVCHIIDTITNSAAKAELDAGYNGARDDGGSGYIQAKLLNWLDGINFITTGKTEIYKDILNDLRNTQDGEWAEFQRLKTKFSDSSNGVGISKI
jgi:hypothetical protein